MSILQDLIQQIDDPILRERISEEVDKLTKSKNFGLVFEEHLPECTPLYDVPIRKGITVALRSGYIGDIYTVVKINNRTAICSSKGVPGQKSFDLDKLVAITKFGEPIYPYLKFCDFVNNAPDSDLWHTLIEADNYHALQLLEYLYPGKVDCIFIDPPYNTGAKDWKYNNNYVDSSDAYRHSKWLSMMEKRLRIAKRLLNPENSVLIVTIDEKEYLHLGCLLEELFPEARRQMVSVAMHAAGVSRAEFSRIDEYYFFIFIGDASVLPVTLGEEWHEDGIKRQKGVRWESLLRSGTNSRREDSPNLFYPVLFDPQTKQVVRFGDPVPRELKGKDYVAPTGLIAVLPYSSAGREACWRISASRARELKNLGAFDWGEYKGESTALKYLKEGELKKIKTGEYVVSGRKDNGAMIITQAQISRSWKPGTQWHVSTHEAGGKGGSNLIKTIFGERSFDFPKSLYAVSDALRFFVKDKPNALILDFFAGSGTTLHAVALLNAEDGGNRRCIMVTNNEVSVDNAKILSKQGYQPGDIEWEKHGIAQQVTWPRVVCSIEGHDVNGKRLEGNYHGSDAPMADGFKANAIFFKLSFLDKTSVALGRQFSELLSVLWMKAGAFGRCPLLQVEELPDMLILPENRFAVLINESAYTRFGQEMAKYQGIRTVYIVTDSEHAYKIMAEEFEGVDTYQLYRDYLDNFQINAGIRL